MTTGLDTVCPVCEALSGQVETMQGWAIRGLPPIHIGCRCDLVALDEFETFESEIIKLNEYLEDIDFAQLDDPFDQAAALRDAGARVLGGF